MATFWKNSDGAFIKNDDGEIVKCENCPCCSGVVPSMRPIVEITPNTDKDARHEYTYSSEREMDENGMYLRFGGVFVEWWEQDRESYYFQLELRQYNREGYNNTSNWDKGVNPPHSATSRNGCASIVFEYYVDGNYNQQCQCGSSPFNSYWKTINGWDDYSFSVTENIDTTTCPGTWWRDGDIDGNGEFLDPVIFDSKYYTYSGTPCDTAWCNNLLGSLTTNSPWTGQESIVLPPRVKHNYWYMLYYNPHEDGPPPFYENSGSVEVAYLEEITNEAIGELGATFSVTWVENEAETYWGAPYSVPEYIRDGDGGIIGVKITTKIWRNYDTEDELLLTDVRTFCLTDTALDDVYEWELWNPQYEEIEEHGFWWNASTGSTVWSP
jgi:hypothetical protein